MAHRRNESASYQILTDVLFIIALVYIIFFQTRELNTILLGSCRFPAGNWGFNFVTGFFKAWGNLLHLFSGLCTSVTVEMNTICNGKL